MESSSGSSDEDERENVNYIPMRPCHQRSKSLPFNHFKLQSATESSRAAVDRKSSAHSTLSGNNASQKSPTSFKEGLQFLESSHNEIKYKTKKVEYILEKEKRARRGSTPTSDLNKMSRLRFWILSKFNANKNLKTADETLRQANETLRSAAEMIVKLDDTMSQEEENLCQRANQLRRRSEVTFKTISSKHPTARRIQSTGDANFHMENRPPLLKAMSIEIDDDIVTECQQFYGQLQNRRKSSISMDDNFLSTVTSESVINY